MYYVPDVCTCDITQAKSCWLELASAMGVVAQRELTPRVLNADHCPRSNNAKLFLSPKIAVMIPDRNDICVLTIALHVG